jgi:hypothetical protein
VVTVITSRTAPITPWSALIARWGELVALRVTVIMAGVGMIGDWRRRAQWDAGFCGKSRSSRVAHPAEPDIPLLMPTRPLRRLTLRSGRTDVINVTTTPPLVGAALFKGGQVGAAPHEGGQA